MPAGSDSVLLREVTPADGDGWDAVEGMWQLYQHDLSGYRRTRLGADGRFGPGRLALYASEMAAARVPAAGRDRAAYVGIVGGSPAGFCLVHGLVDGPQVLGEFFVARSVRRTGVGAALATDVLARHPGAWEIAFQEQNPAAASFWRGLAPEVFASWHEDPRPVPGNPAMPPDVWLVGRT